MVTYDVLSFTLISEYGCSYIEELPIPYQDPEDAPKYWRDSDGSAFTVPMPDQEDGTYSTGLLNRFFQKQGLKKISNRIAAYGS